MIANKLAALEGNIAPLPKETGGKAANWAVYSSRHSVRGATHPVTACRGDRPEMLSM